MSARRVLGSDALSVRVAELAVRRHVPLLVMRLTRTESEQRARKIFGTRVAASLRKADLLAHDRLSDFFTIALAGGARKGGSTVLPQDCRAALERARHAFGAPELRLESGWTFAGGSAPLNAELRVALARGARERQHLELFSPLAHEMRTPLTAIRGFLETVLDETPDAPTSRRFLEIARGETLRLGRLIDGMFTVSLLDLEHDAGCAKHTVLQPALLRAVDVVYLRARERGTRIECGRVPAVTVAISFDNLVQVFVNVLSNAIEHGKQAGRIVMRIRMREREAEIAVDDDGPGISPRELKAVFDPGYRTSHAGRGNGLGLSVVHRLVDLAGGSVWATRSPLGGARIVTRIPTLTG